jgi:UDP-GlcNAc:undecaprenyl-phosphate/decaprenyl-phosphate GlcNAc-1-phosphate transferase
MFSIALAFCAACVVSLALVPVVKRACDRFDLTDRPDNHRKLHRQPVALGGGVVAFLSTLGVSLPLLLLRSEVAPSLHSSGGELIGLLLAGMIILLVGIVDDAVGLRGRQKLLGQLIACSVLLPFGIVIERLRFFGWTVELGLLSVPVTLIWLLAAINAINLLDGINGLAAIIGIIDSLAIAILSAILGHRSQALVGAAFAGSLLGFLRYNFPQAKMFLGDAGSMLIGLMVGGLAVQTSLKGPGTVLLAAPLCLMTIPLFDSAAAMLRRKLTGRSIFIGDCAHLHHRLAERFGATRAVGIVALSCGATASAALISVIWRNELIAVVSAAAIIVMFVVSRMFGYAELRLITSRLHSVARSLFRLNGQPCGPGVQSTVHFQGSREWEAVWAGLTEAVLDLPVNDIELTLSAPMIQEGYHASWRRRATDLANIWRFELPLVVAGHPIGHIRVVGERLPNFPAGALEKILLLFETFESQLETLFIQPAEHAEIGPSQAAKPAVIVKDTAMSVTSDA